MSGSRMSRQWCRCGSSIGSEVSGGCSVAGAPRRASIGLVFSPFVIEQLGYYVYLLSDPRTGEIFYVGKGVGNRVFAHAEDALEGERESDKLDRIRAIRAAGDEVQHELVRFGLNERTAFEVEAAAIELLGLSDLTNVVAGHHVGERGRMSTDDARSLFEAPPVERIKEAVLLIRIPRLWYPSMPPEDLFEATNGWWRLGPRREKAAYAFAVNRGVIREVYRIRSWRERRQGDRDWEDDLESGRPRWGFEGAVAGELAHYRNRSVAHLFKRGEASPVKYVNC